MMTNVEEKKEENKKEIRSGAFWYQITRSEREVKFLIGSQHHPIEMLQSMYFSPEVAIEIAQALITVGKSIQCERLGVLV